MRKEVVIIIAEDDEGHATLIKKNLKRSGIVNEIIHFRGGQETLDYLFQKGEGPKRKNGKPFLLLLDIRMPKGNGIEVLEILKKMPNSPTIIMFTNYPYYQYRKRCMDAGADFFFYKALEFDKLLDTVRNLAKQDRPG